MQRQNKNRVIALVCTAFVAFSALPSGIAAAKTAQGGAIGWNFEDACDIAFSSVGDGIDAGPLCGSWASGEGCVLSRVPSSEISADVSGFGGYSAKCTPDGIAQSVGMRIALSDLQLVPNREYRINADVVYCGNDGEISANTALSKPSDTADGITGTKMSTADGKTSFTGNLQTNVSAVFTASADLYENGQIILHLFLSDEEALTGDVCFDNITVTPTEVLTDRLYSANAKVGKFWDFEEGEGKTAYTAIPGNPGGGSDAVYDATFAKGTWSLVNNRPNSSGKYTDSYFRGPRILPTSAVKPYIHTYKSGDLSRNQDDPLYYGAPAPQSKNCIRMTMHSNSAVAWDEGIVGTRVRITKEEFGTGTFDICAYAAFSARYSNGKIDNYVLNAAVFSGEKQLCDNGTGGDFSNVAADIMTAKTSASLGSVSRWWTKNSAVLNITDDCYDDNGVATLVLYVCPSNGVRAMEPGLTLYLDDISLFSRSESAVMPGASVSCCITAVSDTEIADAKIICAVYDGNDLKSCTVKNEALGELSRKNITVKIANGIQRPILRFFIWNGDLKPLAVDFKINKYEETEILDCKWDGVWTDVLGTCGDEAENPTPQPDGKKSVRLTANDDNFSLKASVFSSDGSLLSESGYSRSVDIEVPDSGDYNVAVSATDHKNMRLGIVGVYDKTQFEKLVSYSIPDFADDGKLKYRSTFEYDYLSLISVSDGANIRFSDESANSGKRSLYVYDRNTSNDTVTLKLAQLLNADKVSVRAYVNCAEDGQNYRLSAEIPLVGSKTASADGTAVTTDGNGVWKKLTLDFNISDYDAASDGTVKISVKTSGTQPFYLDDFTVIADCNGYHTDDMQYEQYPLEMFSQTASVASAKAEPQTELKNLKDVFADYFKIGACTVTSAFSNNDTKYDTLIKKHFNSIVADGAFKRSWIQREAYCKGDITKYDFGALDSTMQAAKRLGIDEVVGHTLVWDLPSTAWTNQDADGNWLDRDSALARMKEYITKVVSHCNGKGDPSEYKSGADYSNWRVPVWDVVNEAAAHTNENVTDGYYWKRGGGHMRIIGKDYVYYAFKYAKEADPDAELRYNDYEDFIGKSDRIVGIVNTVNTPDKYVNGKPLIDTIGYQCHFVRNMSVEHSENTVKKFIATGLNLDITEIDVSAFPFSATNPKMYENGITKMREFEQAMLLRNFFKVLKENAANINRVTFWTVTDKYSRTTSDNRFDYLGIFDRNYKAKPQFYAMTCTDDEFYALYPEAKALFEKTSWNFDRDTDITWNVDLGSWARVSPIDYTQQPKFADGGCLTVPSSYTKSQNRGIRIKLSKSQLAPGKTYTLTFKGKVDGTAYAGKNYYAALQKPSCVMDIYDEPAEFLTSSPSAGTTSASWKDYSTVITPADDMYEDGYTMLYITTSGSLQSGTALYFDDISITQND